MGVGMVDQQWTGPVPKVIFKVAVNSDKIAYDSKIEGVSLPGQQIKYHYQHSRRC